MARRKKGKDDESRSRFVPDLFAMFAGIEFSFNIYRVEGSGKFETKLHDLIKLRILDIEMFGITTADGQEDTGVGISFLGLRFCWTSSDEKSFSINCDPKIIPLYLCLMIFMLFSHAGGGYFIPPVLATIVPVWAVEVAKLSFVEALISWRSFVLCVETLAAMTNSIIISRGDIRQKSAEHYGGFFSHRIWYFVAMMPFILMGYHPLACVLFATICISIRDARNSDYGIFMFNWNVFNIHPIVFGYNQDGKFMILDFASILGEPGWKRKNHEDYNIYDSFSKAIAKPLGFGMDWNDLSKTSRSRYKVVREKYENA